MPQQPGLRIVGVLGGIGSGKTTVAELLAEILPATHLNADAEVRKLFQDPGCRRDLVETFGSQVLTADGSPDRDFLAREIFSDAGRRRQLEQILHPGVRRALHHRLMDLAAGGTPEWAVLDVPLLLEGGLASVCASLIFVAVPDEIRAQRVQTRSGLTEKEWRRREAAQISLQEKQNAADVILENVGSREHLRQQIRDLLPHFHRLPPTDLRERWPEWDQELPARKL